MKGHVSRIKFGFTCFSISLLTIATNAQYAVARVDVGAFTGVKMLTAAFDSWDDKSWITNAEIKKQFVDRCKKLGITFLDSHVESTDKAEMCMYLTLVPAEDHKNVQVNMWAQADVSPNPPRFFLNNGVREQVILKDVQVWKTKEVCPANSVDVQGAISKVLDRFKDQYNASNPSGSETDSIRQPDQI